MMLQNIFFKNSILFIIGIFLCVPMLVFGQTNPTTQQVLNPLTNTTLTIPASWNVSAGNWSSLQPAFNPITNTWIQVPLGWVIPPSVQTNPINPNNWVIPTTPGTVPGASSDPLNPGTTTTTSTASTTLGAPITDGNKTIAKILGSATTIIQSLLPVLIALATIIFIISIIMMIKDDDSEEKRTQAKKVMIQSIFALFILISAWGIVAILSATFGFEFGLPVLSA